MYKCKFIVNLTLAAVIKHYCYFSIIIQNITFINHSYYEMLPKKHTSYFIKLWELNLKTDNKELLTGYETFFSYLFKCFIQLYTSVLHV